MVKNFVVSQKVSTFVLRKVKHNKTIQPYRNTVKRKNMKYSVYYNNNVEYNKVAEFYTLDEAKAYCNKNTEGYNEIGDDDNCYEGRSNNFCYEVYEGDNPIIVDEDGDVADLKPSVYQTKQYYC